MNCYWTKGKANVLLLFNLKAVRRWVGCFDRSLYSGQFGVVERNPDQNPPVNYQKQPFLLVPLHPYPQLKKYIK